MIKGANIGSSKGDWVNRLVYMLGDKLVSFKLKFLSWSPLNTKKRRSHISKSFDISDSESTSFDLLFEQLIIFTIESGHIQYHAEYMFVKIKEKFV